MRTLRCTHARHGFQSRCTAAPPGEIGGNRILLEWDEHRWLLDFGTRFGRTGKVFAEFVNPCGATLTSATTSMSLLTPLEGLYRPGLA